MYFFTVRLQYSYIISYTNKIRYIRYIVIFKCIYNFNVDNYEIYICKTVLWIQKILRQFYNLDKKY